MKNNDNKTTILIAAFGSSYESGLDNLAVFDSAVRKAFPDNEVFWGLTGNIVVNRLRQKGTTELFPRKAPLMNIRESMEYLAETGRSEVLVVNFLIMPGTKYRQVLFESTRGLNVKYVHPLLCYPENLKNAILAMETEIAESDQTATVFCAHGNEEFIQFNAELEQIDFHLRNNYRNTFLTTIEGRPEWPPVRDEILSSDVKKVKFISFMLTYGDHMKNDVMGDGDESMKSSLGLPATATDGLAVVPAIQDLFIEKMRHVLNDFA